MELKDFDWSKTRFSPLSKTFTTNIAHAIPAFKAYEGKKKREVFRYVVALYDKKSPLWEKEPEYFLRKRLAADLCGLSDETRGGSYTKFAMEIMEGQNEEVNKLVTAYLANLGDPEYTMLITELGLYFSLYMRQASGKMLDGTEYRTMLSVLENIKTRTNIIFGSGEDDEINRVKNLLYQHCEADRQKLHPEAVVAIVEKDGDVPADWCAYGSGYEIDDLKFYQDETQGEAAAE